MTKTKVVFCTPTRDKPHPAYIAALEASVPALEAAGIDHYVVTEVGSAYISWARANMLRKALDAMADMVIFIDDDVSWGPDDLVKLIKSKPDVVAGVYRFKLDDEESYMGELATDDRGQCKVNEDGLIYATKVPAGFLKVTANAVIKIMDAHPELIYGLPFRPIVDLFNHGVHKDRLWWGEDYAFSRRWIEDGHDLFIMPNLDLTHHGKDREYVGNFHEYMLRRPGGAKDSARTGAVPEVAAMAA